MCPLCFSSCVRACSPHHRAPEVRFLTMPKTITQKLMVQAQKFELQEPRRDKYFRILAKVMADGEEVAQELVKAGLAVSYDGGKKQKWCRP